MRIDRASTIEMATIAWSVVGAGGAIILAIFYHTVRGKSSNEDLSWTCLSNA